MSVGAYVLWALLLAVFITCIAWPVSEHECKKHKHHHSQNQDADDAVPCTPTPTNYVYLTQFDSSPPSAYNCNNDCGDGTVTLRASQLNSTVVFTRELAYTYGSDSQNYATLVLPDPNALDVGTFVTVESGITVQWSANQNLCPYAIWVVENTTNSANDSFNNNWQNNYVIGYGSSNKVDFVVADMGGGVNSWQSGGGYPFIDSLNTNCTYFF